MIVSAQSPLPLKQCDAIVGSRFAAPENTGEFVLHRVADVHLAMLLGACKHAAEQSRERVASQSRVIRDKHRLCRLNVDVLEHPVLSVLVSSRDGLLFRSRRDAK